jgi:F0F1-type ATP synthase membrane subunit b/b'
MANADAEAERLVKEGEDRAREEAKALLDKAAAEAAETRRRGEEAAEREREKARQELAGDIAAFAAEVAGRLVGRAAAAEDARAAEHLVRELEAGRAR